MDKQIRNIVFDVGSVLIDFCWKKPCIQFGFGQKVIDALEKNMIQSSYWSQLDRGMITTEEAIEQFVKEMPQYEKEIRQFWTVPELFVEEYAYAAPVITWLKQQGYKVYLLSNYPYEMYKLHWSGFRFFPLVDGYLVSAEHKLIKPDPAIYRLFCDMYQLEPATCLFLDDRQVNVDAAIGIGMHAVQFEGEQTLQQVFGDWKH